MDASLANRAEELARQIASEASSIDELNGLFRSMMAWAIQGMLDSEKDLHLSSAPTTAKLTDIPISEPSPTKPKNRHNGHSKKTVCGDIGEITIATPHDRDGTFEPQLIRKYQRRLEGFD